MSEREEGEENTPRGNEWEVVSLTASAYAASPGPREIDLKSEDKDSYSDAETSHALVMSRHFVFPPDEHENLPVQPIDSEIHDEKVRKGPDPELDVELLARSTEKGEEDLSLKELDLPDELTGIQLHDGKGKKEQSLYDKAMLSSFHSELVIGGSTAYEAKESVAEAVGGSEGGLDVHKDVLPKPPQDEKHTESNIPCEAWWRRSVASLYAHVKEANALWSVFVAAAVMGLVIVGQRWHQERWQFFQLKWQSNISSEKTNHRMSDRIVGLKDMLASGNGRESFSRASTVNDC